MTMSNYKNEQERLYFEELEYVEKKGPMLRNVVVLSAMMEALMYSLAKSYLNAKGIAFNPNESQEYSMSRNILETNSILTTTELKEIDEFRKFRKSIFHNLFKGEFTKRDFDNFIKKAWKIGLKVVQSLHIKQLSAKYNN